MQSIKFRVWEKQSKKMLYYDKDIVPNMTLNGVLINEVGSNVSNMFELMQFTGLLDKNGKEIYGGDILKYSGKNEKDKNYEVYQLEAGTWMACNEIYFDTKDNAYFDKVEIIGNIHNNPELLK